MNDDMPDFSAMTEAEIVAWLKIEREQITTALWRAYQIAGMKKTAGRWFRERHKYPLGSKERLERQGGIRSARDGIRSLRGPETEFHAFEFDQKTAALIEAMAAQRGISVTDLLTEAMRIAFWRYGFADGIKVTTSSSDDSPDDDTAELLQTANRLFARIGAAEKALRRFSGNQL